MQGCGVESAILLVCRPVVLSRHHNHKTHAGRNRSSTGDDSSAPSVQLRRGRSMLIFFWLSGAGGGGAVAPHATVHPRSGVRQLTAPTLRKMQRRAEAKARLEQDDEDAALALALALRLLRH